MESKIDWLTLTIKPEKEDISFCNLLHTLQDTLLLDDLYNKMVRVPRVAHYDVCLGYENITLCCPPADRFREQGFCLRFSSQALDFFTRYLDTYNITLKQWLGMFRALCFQGYVTKCTRLDYAMDDIHFNGEKPIITMEKIINSSRKGEMCKKARVVDLYDGDGITIKERFKVVNKEPVVGRTLNFGSRQSEVFCRFYDKLAEQLQKKQPIPENCTSWTRCEFEFKNSASMSVLNAFLDYDDYNFGNYMRGVANNYVSFIVRSKNNVSRCPVKKWWSEFLCGCTKKFRLPHKLPARSAYAKARRGLIQYLSIMYTLWRELGAAGVYKFFKREFDFKHLGNVDLYKPELAQNIRDGVLDYEKMNGFKCYQYNSNDDKKHYDLKGKIHKQWSEYTSLSYKAHHLKGYMLERHLAFINGQEVLS